MRMLFDLMSGDKRLMGLPLKEVIYQLENGHFPIHSKIHNPVEKDWEFVYENPIIARLLAFQLCRKQVSYNYDSLFQHWVLKNYLSSKDTFSLMEVILMLQKNEISATALIKHPKVMEWTEVKKVPVFFDESVRCLYKIHKLKDYFIERQGPRTRT